MSYMGSPEELLDATDWSALKHAYGNAGDLPARLLRLLSQAPEAAGAALAELDAFVLHQGTIYSCTAPAATFVAAILADPRTAIDCRSALPWDTQARPLRA